MAKQTDRLRLGAHNLTADAPTVAVVRLSKAGNSVLEESVVPEGDFYRVLDMVAQHHGVLEVETHEAAGEGVAFYLISARKPSRELTAILQAQATQETP